MNSNNTIIISDFNKITEMFSEWRKESDKIAYAAGFQDAKKLQKKTIPWVAEEDACELLKITKETIREKRETHKFRCIAPGKGLFYHIDSLIAYFDNAEKIEI